MHSVQPKTNIGVVVPLFESGKTRVYAVSTGRGWRGIWARGDAAGWCGLPESDVPWGMERVEDLKAFLKMFGVYS